MSSQAGRPVPVRDHPTGVCSDLIPQRDARGVYQYEQDGTTPKRAPCGGKLEHTGTKPYLSEVNPGQQEYKCKSCGLVYVVSERRWKDDKKKEGGSR